MYINYRKIPLISPGLITDLFKGLFWCGLIFGGAYFWRGLLLAGILGFKMGWTNGLKHEDNSLKQLTLKQLTANPNSPWAYIREGLLLEGYLHLKI